MKIYLCATKPEEKTHQWVSNMAVFNGMVEDSEAVSIVCDNFVSCFTHEELVGFFEKIVSKMRLNSELVIMHPDIHMLSHRLYREEIDMQALNDILFKNGAIKSVCSVEKIQQALPSNIEVTHQNFDMTTSIITIKATRTQ